MGCFVLPLSGESASALCVYIYKGMAAVGALAHSTSPIRIRHIALDYSYISTY
jgi:hypothetical protein